MLLIAKRYSNREIAESLVISVNTVKWYARNIYSKLGLADDVDKRKATRHFVQQHLLPPRSDVLRSVAGNPIPFSGRDAELQIIGRQLQDPHHRLITILAPGGMGKSRLALQAANQAQGHFPDGTIFIQLHESGKGFDLLVMICRELDLHNYPTDERPFTRLIDYLRNKRLLLVIDNGEHIENPDTIATLLKYAPGLSVLVASRRRLELSVETIHTLTGLAYPAHANDRDLNTSPAIQLLTNCVRRFHPNFELQNEDKKAALEIVKQVDGMPLAIVIAAAWADIMPLPRIAEEISQSQDFLSTDLADIPPRQRSIRLVIESAWAALSADERTACERLSIFSGGFSLDAAIKVTEVSVSAIKRLVNKSLVSRGPNGRLLMHELVRQYGEEKWQQSADVEPVIKRYIHYFMDYVSHLEHSLAGNRQIDAFDQVDREFDNIITAWRMAIQTRAFDELHRCMTVLLIYFLIRASNEDRERMQAWIESLIQDAPDHPIQADILLWQNWSLVHSQDWQQVERTQNELMRAARIARQHYKPITQVYCEYRLGWLARQQRNYSLAIEHFTAALEVAKQHGFGAVVADSYVRSASVRLVAGIPGDPDSQLEEATRAYVQIDDQYGLQIVSYLRAVYHKLVGQYDMCEHMLNEAWRLKEELNFSTGELLLHAQGHLSFLRGDFDHVKACAQQVTQLHRDQPQTQPIQPSRLWGFVRCVEGNYVEAYTILDRLYHDDPNHNEFSEKMNAHGLSLAYMGLGDDENARKKCAESLKFAIPRSLYGFVSWCLPVAAWLYMRSGEPEHAIRALEIARHFSPTESGWIDQWSLLAGLKRELRQIVGGNVYEKIQSQAAETDLMTVASSAQAFLTNM